MGAAAFRRVVGMFVVWREYAGSVFKTRGRSTELLCALVVVLRILEFSFLTARLHDVLEKWLVVPPPTKIKL